MTRYLLRFAPAITPCCGVLGAIAGLAPLRSPLTDVVQIFGFVILAAAILGGPAGLLFWTMNVNDEGTKRLWTGIMIAYCFVLFTLFYLPIHGLVSV
jgi:heme/copper-type cytochrome/quinol oxidase subunit 1